jgi:hypothetical protein
MEKYLQQPNRQWERGRFINHRMSTIWVSDKKEIACPVPIKQAVKHNELVGCNIKLHSYFILLFIWKHDHGCTIVKLRDQNKHTDKSQ